jgi:hypothetical protein
MGNKQTAVQWLIQYLNNVKPNEFCSIEKIKELLEQAKEMEKQQMIKFALHLHYVDMSLTGTDILMAEAEHYYEQTYGGKDGK